MCPQWHHAVALRKHTGSSFGEQDGVGPAKEEVEKREADPYAWERRVSSAPRRAQYNDERELFAQRQDEMTAALSEAGHCSKP